MFGHDPRNAIQIPVGATSIPGILERLPRAFGTVVLAYGTASGRLSPRNNFVAAAMRRAGLGTLMVDLLTSEEDLHYARRLDIDLLAHRLRAAVEFLDGDEAGAVQPVGLFAGSTVTAAALRVAASLPARIRAVVSQGGRPDLVGKVGLERVRAPTLLMVGGQDAGVIELNEEAFDDLVAVEDKELRIIPGASPLFEEAGSLEEVAGLASAWFRRCLVQAAGA